MTDSATCHDRWRKLLLNDGTNCCVIRHARNKAFRRMLTKSHRRLTWYFCNIDYKAVQEGPGPTTLRASLGNIFLTTVVFCVYFLVLDCPLSGTSFFPIPSIRPQHWCSVVVVFFPWYQAQTMTVWRTAGSKHWQSVHVQSRQTMQSSIVKRISIPVDVIYNANCVYVPHFQSQWFIWNGWASQIKLNANLVESITKSNG